MYKGKNKMQKEKDKMQKGINKIQNIEVPDIESVINTVVNLIFVNVNISIYILRDNIIPELHS